MKRINENLDPTLGAASYNVQGSHTGYVYRVLNVTHGLEQKPNKISEDRLIHVGCMVKGYDVNDPDIKYQGQVTQIIKDKNGIVKCLKIKNINDNKFVLISPERITLIVNKEDKTFKPKFALAPSHNIKI